MVTKIIQVYFFINFFNWIINIILNTFLIK